MSSFRKWMGTQVGRGDPVGDLAADIQSDETAVNIQNTKSAWLSHIQGRNACTGAIEAMKDAWIEYRWYLDRGGR